MQHSKFRRFFHVPNAVCRSPQPGHHGPRAVGDVQLLVVGEDAGGVVDQAGAEGEEAAGVGGLGH